MVMMDMMTSTFKPQRVTVPEFELVSNPTIAKGPSANWFREFYRKEAYLRHKGRLDTCADLQEVKEYILTMVSFNADVIRQVVTDHFPQYKELTDKIIMLQ